MTKILEKVFSVKNDERKTHKVISIVGLKFKYRISNHNNITTQQNNNNASITIKAENKKAEKPTLPYIETHLCDHCNLNCKGCGHHCNSVKEEIFTDIIQYTKDINELAKKIYIRQIRLMGGEPLLHPEVNKFMIETRKAFPKSDIRLVTNGILLPSMKEDFWQTCRANKIKIDLSKYPIVGNKFSEYLDLLDDNDVELGMIHLSKKFYSKRNPKGDSDYIQAFNACKSKRCVNLWHSKLWTCSAVYRYYYNVRFNTNFDLPIGIDIYAVSGKEIVETLNKPDPACRWCLIKAVAYPWEKEA